MTSTTPITAADYSISASAPVEEILNVLKLHGGVMLKGFLSSDDALKLKAEVQPSLDELGPKKNENDKGWDGDFFPSTTRKVSGMVTKSPTYVDKILLSPLIEDVANDILTVRTKLGFPHSQGYYATSKPIFNVGPTLQIHPGAERQPLHRDDYIFHRQLDGAPKWTHGRDVSILCFVACTPVTPENGGTLFVPGSHLFDEECEVSYEDAHAATMDPGDAFLFLGRTIHAGGANIMKEGEPNSVRTLVGIGFCQGVLRQEENVHINNSLEDLGKLPRAALEKLGFSPSVPMLGWYKFGHALNYFDGYNIPDSDELVYDKDQSDHPIKA